MEETAKQFAEVTRRARVDSGFTEETESGRESGSPGLRDSVSLYQDTSRHVREEDDVFTRRTRNLSTNSTQGRFRVFFEEGNVSGAQRIMIEDTFLETPERFHVYVPE